MNDRTHLDCFSGIAGFALAARANGVRTIQFIEIEPRCQAFLGNAWPGIPIYDDINTYQHDGRPVWLLTAGVPCQPASRAGKQRGSQDDRWLWPAALRVLAEVRPAWALFENPPGIGDVGLTGILSGVEAQDYEVRVVSIPACAVGAPHGRERYWILAHRATEGRKRSNATMLQGRRERQRGQPVEARLAHRQSLGRETTAHEGLPRQDGRAAEESGGVQLGTDSGCLADAEPSERRKNPERRGHSQQGNDGQGQAASRAGIHRQDMADTPQRGQREHGSAPGDTGHADERGKVCEHCKGRGYGLANFSDDHFSPCPHCCWGLVHPKEIRGGTGLCDCGQTGQRRNFLADSSQWQRFVWLPCADGKVRRAPDDSFGLVDGLHRSLLAALGNSIVPQVAQQIIAAMIAAEKETDHAN